MSELRSTSSLDWSRLETLFHRVVEMPDAERAEFLDRQCEGDPELRRYLDELLSADGEVSVTWEGLRLPGPADAECPEIPGYRDLQLLGHGGMGSVYLGRRHDELFDGRAFAIKVLHTHRTGERGKRRFDTERRLLAELDHPNIVRLYDGGELTDGRPYLVMDHVDGQPLDAYCRQHRCTIEERLGLFQKICGALHTAHQNLIVHRDLKPSNILVDGEGVPHLLDFGIAKDLGESPSDLSTTGWFVPMTPAYASPEQISGRPVTTASDLYSLGLVLFELLTDRLPDPPRSGDEIRPDPPRPSQWVDDEAETVADDRQTTVSRLRRRLRGDLDHIVAKALRVEPEARYASARELAEDLDRHLGFRPVLARRGSWRYLATRYLRRHRWRVAVLGSALLVLTFAAIAGVQSQRLRAAEEAGAEKDRLVRRLAGPEADFLLSDGGLDEAVAAIVELDVSDDTRSLLLDAVRRLHLPDDQLLDRIAELLREESIGPAITPGIDHAALTLGQLLLQRASFERAEEVLALSLGLAERVHGEEALELALILEAYAHALAELERYPDGVASLRRSLDLRRQHNGAGADVARPLASLATLLYLQGAFETSAKTCREALQALDQTDDADPFLRASVLTSLSVALMELDPDDPQGEAEATARQALQLHLDTFGSDHMQTLASRHNLAAVLGRSGRSQQALAVGLENLALSEQLLGRDHPRIAYILQAIAGAHLQLGQAAECAEAARRSTTLRQESLPADSWLTAISQTRLATCLADLGETDEAIDLLRASVGTFSRSKVKDDVWPARAQAELDALLSPDP